MTTYDTGNQMEMVEEGMSVSAGATQERNFWQNFRICNIPENKKNRAARSKNLLLSGPVESN